MIKLLWDMTRGYRLTPWRSPYVLWRLETYTGLRADQITFGSFWEICWESRTELIRYLHWAERMRS